MSDLDQHQGQPAFVVNAAGSASAVLVCEHASNHIPAAYGGLGLSEDVRQSHVAWDPGAYAVAAELARLLDAPLVAAGVSRLVYDCNRPPEAPGAMPARSEVHDIPGNRDLDAEARAQRVRDIYAPFRDTLARAIGTAGARALVTIHSFTPVYFGQRREVEIGILHDSDSRLADRMLALAAGHTDRIVQRNAPYGPQDGVTHTLREHGVRNGVPNVMIELRNDLIADPAAQTAMAAMLAGWTRAALAALAAAEARG